MPFTTIITISLGNDMAWNRCPFIALINYLTHLWVMTGDTLLSIVS